MYQITVRKIEKKATKMRTFWRTSESEDSWKHKDKIIKIEDLEKLIFQQRMEELDINKLAVFLNSQHNQ